VTTSKNGFFQRARRAGLLVALLFAAFSCQRETEDPTGGETHFLVRCEPNSNSCGSKLACLCGICTTPCTERAACEHLPSAACVSSIGADACGDVEAQGHCDVACLIDADCAVLSDAHRCELGACRAGSSADVCVRGDVSANQVLLIGDIFFASSHQIAAYLEDFARSAGALALGERYRDNSRATDNALASGGIADQYASAVSDAEVKVVIMSGGGADLLIGNCDPADASCPTIAGAAAAARELLAEVGTNGVSHVVYAFYPDPVDANLRAKIDALRPLLENACESSTVNCHWLDLRPAFANHYGEYVAADGISPTQAGAQASARAIWGVMQSECIAQ